MYDGQEGPYAEGFPATETNFYGFSKSCGEPGGAMIIRTSIIGEERGETKVSLLEFVRGRVPGGHSNVTGYTGNIVILMSVMFV